jgi:hypothetical protein
VYNIEFEKDKTIVTVNNGSSSTIISFEGINHEDKAMRFISSHCMVQMGQIGY